MFWIRYLRKTISTQYAIPTNLLHSYLVSDIYIRNLWYLLTLGYFVTRDPLSTQHVLTCYLVIRCPIYTEITIPSNLIYKKHGFKSKKTTSKVRFYFGLFVKEMYMFRNVVNYGKTIVMLKYKHITYISSCTFDKLLLATMHREHSIFGIK